ncbi:MAG: amidohydrolase family protein [Candidatus Latescibacterota bacterium]
MHDLVIRGANIVDGTGVDAYVGDIAVDSGIISSVGGKAGQATREILADGAMVSPGWVDVHTHYDGQVTWDPIVGPSSWHGVTSIVMGNCGVGFAPVKPADHNMLIELMEGVEDIPGAALHEGVPWGWESFSEFMDVLEKMPRALDVATQVPHNPVRAYVMGKDAASERPSTQDERDQMSAIVAEGLAAGAIGFTTSRTKIPPHLHWRACAESLC